MSVTPLRPLDGLTILVVDDHRDTVDMLQEYLGTAGATVMATYSAKTALVFMETRLDAVLVDLRMPGEDGWWLLRQVRGSRMPGAANTAVFAMSGERHDALDPANGFAGYFFKPVDLDALVAALAALPRGPR